MTFREGKTSHIQKPSQHHKQNSADPVIEPAVPITPGSAMCTFGLIKVMKFQFFRYFILESMFGIYLSVC